MIYVGMKQEMEISKLRQMKSRAVDEIVILMKTKTTNESYIMNFMEACSQQTRMNLRVKNLSLI